MDDNTNELGSTDHSDLDGLLPFLHRLDQCLEQAIAAAPANFRTEAAGDPYRGMHIDPIEVDQLLTREPGAPAFQRYGEPNQPIPPTKIPPDSRLAWLRQTFGLSDFDLDLVAIALAPELDRRYEHLYAYLQDDVHCRQPSVDLALNLLCANAAEKLEQRRHFAPNAPLIQHGLLHLIPNPNQTKSTLLTHELHLDDQVVRFLLHQPGLDGQLVPFCQLIAPNITPSEWLNQPDNQALTMLVKQEWRTDHPLRLYFQGRDRPSKWQAAVALAQAIAAPLLVADLSRLVQAKVDLEPTLNRLLREAWFQTALLYLDEWDALQTDEQRMAYQMLLQTLADSRGITILAGEQPWRSEASEPLGVLTIAFPLPDFAQRRRYWQTYLKAADFSLNERDLDALADRFRLTSVQIADAISTAIQDSKLKTQNLAFVDLFAAARAQAGHGLGALARKVEPTYGWNDLILPTDQLTQLQELCNQATYRHVVYGDWGFCQRLSLGKGLNVLFSGLPGTGKTMAAEVIAHELQLDLYKIDLSQVVSKYIGETEKNLDRIFTAAANSNAILLFDEADALFGKRSEVQDAHDRYANIEIGYLLQKMEEYEGIAILTTNIRSSMDDAFVRRLRFIIEFPLPDESDRLRIWEQIWPTNVPRSPDLDLYFLAHRFAITGASIRNIALAAAFLAADDGKVVTMRHILHAVQREYQKMGKVLMEDFFASS